MQSNRILITGGSGFLGWNLLRDLGEAGILRDRNPASTSSRSGACSGLGRFRSTARRRSGIALNSDAFNDYSQRSALEAGGL